MSASMEAALWRAVRAGSTEEIEAAVLRGADVNARDEGGETALTLATGTELGPERAQACVQCLLRLGARVSEEKPRGGLGTSVHQASAHGYTGALRALLSADGNVSLNTFDDMGRTPLICAVDNRRLLEASLLLEAGADVDAQDSAKIGNSALSYAIQNRDLPMVELLLKHGADPTIEGWMHLSALDRAMVQAANDSAPELNRILELTSDAAKHRTPRS